MQKMHASWTAGGMWRLSVALALAAVPLSGEVAVTPDPDVRSVLALQRFLSDASATDQYSASRRLEASGSGRRAWLDVQTDYTRTEGMRYSVLDEGGSGIIRSRVLHSLLEEERTLIARGGESRVAISSDNYQLTPQEVDENGRAVVGLRPLRKDRSLIGGRMLLTLDGELVRVEGRLAKNPSFWLTQVKVVRTYRRINGVTMPVSLDSTAQLRLLGSSSLRMTYDYLEVGERAVEERRIRNSAFDVRSSMFDVQGSR